MIQIFRHNFRNNFLADHQQGLVVFFNHTLTIHTLLQSGIDDSKNSLPAGFHVDKTYMCDVIQNLEN